MRTETAAISAVVVAAVVVAPIGPVQLTYVYSGSMEPAIGVNDGVVLGPAGEIDEGDIVTFRSEQKDAFVTHRVVDRTSDGLVTKGDANSNTDQATGLPPVDRSQVVGKAVTVGDSAVTIPAVGILASTVQERPLIPIAAVALAAGISLLTMGRTPTPSRGTPDVPVTAGEVLNMVFIAALLTTLGITHLGASTQAVSFTATEDGGDASDTIAVDNETVRTLPFNVSASGSGHYAVDTQGMTVENRSLNESTLAVTVRIPPPESPGQVSKTVRVYHYPTVLPPAVTARLEAIHPLAGVTGSVLAILGPLYLLTVIALDPKRPLHPPRSKRLKSAYDRLI